MASREETLERLALTFSVRDIMVPENQLVCASNEEEARRLLDRYPDFNLIPIRRDGRLREYLERDSASMTSITLFDLVGDGTSLLEIIDIFQERTFCFVLRGRCVAGYTHFSDLNNPLVRLS